MTPAAVPWHRRRRVGLRRLKARASLATLSLTQAGCSIVSPLPLWELTKATGAAVSMAVPYVPTKASNTVYHEHSAFRSLCIEYNPDAAVEDLVPALQRALKKSQVNSRLYTAGSTPDSCGVWLRYTVLMEWDIPPFAADHRAYVKFASLSLRSAQGEVLSSSQYQLDSSFGTSKWASTEKKLEPVVAALLTGFQN